MTKRNKIIIVLTVLCLFVAGAFYYKAGNPTIEDMITASEYSTHELVLEKVLTKNDSSTFFKVTVENKTDRAIRYSDTGFTVSNKVESFRSYSAYLNDEQKFVLQEGKIPANSSTVVDFLVNLTDMSVKEEWEISLEIISD